MPEQPDDTGATLAWMGTACPPSAPGMRHTVFPWWRMQKIMQKQRVQFKKDTRKGKEK
ncbi:MAG: hypothetical protein LBU75_09520 [Desulfovibrio sp.]|jgi:hypothetical protein|nr:hypothetical protein [Desulfovibrio sp.]